MLARLEASDPKLGATGDDELAVVSHHGGPAHVHVPKLVDAGAYHVGVLVEGIYDPGATAGTGHGCHHGSTTPLNQPERFVR